MLSQSFVNNECSKQSLENSLLTTWNAQVLDYDTKQFSFDQWVLEKINSLGYNLDYLHNLHQVVPIEKSAELSRKLIKLTNMPDFRRMAYRFIKEVIIPKGNLDIEIALQRFFNIRILLPHQPQMIIPFHTGLWYGHGPGSRSIWMPLTDQTRDEDASASLQIIKLEKSRELMQFSLENRLTMDEMQELFFRQSFAVKAGPGQVLFFTQEHIHGNIVNETNKTRVSIDFRLAESKYGDQLCRKQPGGYFELFDHAETKIENNTLHYSSRRISNNTNNSNQVIISYQNNNTSFTKGIPIYLQRFMVEDYCQRNNINYTYEQIDLETMDHLPTLVHFVDELKPSAIIMFSIYALPEDLEFRNKILDAATKNNIVIHFANEDEIIRNEDDRKRCESILKFAKWGLTGSDKETIKREGILDFSGNGVR